MAKMGRREVKKNINPNPAAGLAAPVVNLIATPVIVRPVSTLDLQPSFFGSPIMREGFITITGPKMS